MYSQIVTMTHAWMVIFLLCLDTLWIAVTSSIVIILSAYTSVCLSVCLSVYLSIGSSVYLSVCMYICMYCIPAPSCMCADSPPSYTKTNEYVSNLLSRLLRLYQHIMGGGQPSAISHHLWGSSARATVAGHLPSEVPAGGVFHIIQSQW